MAEVDTSVYRNLGAGNDPLKQPLAIMQLLGAVNQNKLQNMEIGSRQGVSDAYANNPNPDLATIARAAGPNAPVVLNQAIQNQQLQNALRQTQQDTVQRRVGAIAATLGPKASITDYEKAIVQAASDNPTIPSDMWTKRLDEAHKVASDPKELQKWGLAQGTTAPGFDALGGVGGPPDERGNPRQISSAAAVQQRNQPGGMQTALSPEAVAAQTAAGSGAGTAFSGAAQAAGDFKSQITPLTKIIHLLDTVGPKGQGIGTETSNSIKNIAEGLGILKPGTTLPVEELKKYYTQNVLRNSDISAVDKMTAAVHGNPNIDLNTASASDLAKTDLGLRRMKQAQALALLHVKKEDYQTKAAEFNNSQDPVGYLFDTMSPENQRKYLSTLKPGSPEDQRFRTSLGMAHKYELLERQNAKQ